VLRPIIRVEMELRSRVSVNVTVQARNSETWVLALAVFGWIEFFLRKRRYKQPQAIKLDRRHQVLEEAMEIVDGNDFATRNITEFGAISQEDCRWKLGQEFFRQVEVNVEALQAGEHFNLHLGK
jgi:uncharacterized membrane protein